jgi:hypothetical protein
MIEMEFLVFELLNQHSDNFRTIEFVPRSSPDLIAKIIKQLKMSRGEDELDTVVCGSGCLIRSDSSIGHYV